MSLTIPVETSCKPNSGVTKSNEDLLECNITHAPITNRSMQVFFDALDPEKKGFVKLDVLRAWYKSLDFIGTNPTDREIEFAIKEHIHTENDGLTFDEFTLFMLKISQW